MFPKSLSWKRPTIPYRDDTEPSSSLLPKEEEEDYSYPRPHRSTCRTACAYLTLAISSLIIGLIAGQFIRAEYEVDGFVAPFASPHRNTHNIVWQENATFASDPSAENDAAWISLIPVGMGFVEHPVLAPRGTPRALSVYHEIHCLHGLRTSFFTTHYRLAQLASLHPTSSPSTPAYPAYTPNAYLDELVTSDDGFDLIHIKHCFDYLRQALMCAVDTNLEDVKFTPGGEHGNAEGWGTRRTCRDYAGVKEWAERWRVTGQTGIGGN
ncbi:hypothetical protein P153DRAFT_306518 [Dothidotthia symphoricarpi CBS 119687]|uniref:Tat pathway signal sequence n=1 Tax=Dothidotthia symphoricarpi CBS 119687 TaxID=1392245 RepID=A0A6A6ARQ0_9PLEO|nr:uncharacterized protein P153DRAFT_306518 [Dothidotthia symphoricarpi CBS 119687]KAF2133883.1 hypothetical protein P153DRAFT_306518 [Dothidotthia symphoricarpi CBS 119687]